MPPTAGDPSNPPSIAVAMTTPDGWHPLPHARALFDDTPQRNRCTVAYNTLITACLKARDLRAARHLFDEMQRRICTVHVANAAVDMYCKCGDVDSAREVFMTTRQRSVVSWNALIAGFSLNGHGVEGIDLFQEMRRQGVEPNAVTFLAVLGCCAHAGAIDIGREIFQSMLSEYSIEPTIEHYGCMVDLFGRSGHLEEAHALIQGMPMKPNAAMWGALLSACRAHAGLGIAEVALKELINLEPGNSGNYVLLANLYAETERWEEAGEVRRLMRSMSVNKAPGQSLMEEAEFQLTDSYQ